MILFNRLPSTSQVAKVRETAGVQVGKWVLRFRQPKQCTVSLKQAVSLLGGCKPSENKKKQSKAVLNILVSNMEIIFTIAGFFLSTQTLRCIL